MTRCIEPVRPRRGFASARVLLLLVVLGGASVASILTFRPLFGSASVDASIPFDVVRRGDLRVGITEQGTLESSNNTEIKCRVRGDNTITWVVESGTVVEAGQELLHLDPLVIEEEISERTKFAHLAESQVARSKADVTKAELAVEEYTSGRYVAQMSALEKELAIANTQLLTARNKLDHVRMMAASEYARKLKVEEREFAVDQADLDVDLAKVRIEVLEKFTRAEELATLNGALAVARAQHEADVETAFADNKRLKRALEELDHCVVEAPRSGLVIYPTGKKWEQAPDIEEGATVHKDQVLLLMPDLAHMRVKFGVHESVVDRIRPGMRARVTIGDEVHVANITSVAAAAEPAGWWTGNVVKYDTVVELPESEGLKPGMTVEVEVVVEEHADVLLVPTAAVLETEDGHACWVRTKDGLARRVVELGDSDDQFLVVRDGLHEGDEVVVDPLAHVAEAREEVSAAIERSGANALAH